jgi:hypothetical protein
LEPPEFLVEPDYAMSTPSGDPNAANFMVATDYDSDGCSKVQFHTSNSPGDNFQVKARLRTKVGAQATTSATMTVWRRLRVELDSMGEITGVTDPDDLLQGYVPDPPASSLIVSALNAAYIEVQFVGPGTSTNVDFQVNVPTFNDPNFSDPAWRQEIIDQGLKGRDIRTDPNNWSTADNWLVYAQGAYNGAPGYDNDPDSEQIIMIGINAWDLYGPHVALIYMEAIRDFAAEHAPYDESFTRQRFTLHELGHQLGIGKAHLSGGAMSYELHDYRPQFLPVEIRKIRTARTPGKDPTH